jgi:hypothetical protein
VISSIQPNLGLKVFTDAHDTVTVEEGDRYPLRPPFCVIKDTLVQISAFIFPFRINGLEPRSSKLLILKGNLFQKHVYILDSYGIINPYTD